MIEMAQAVINQPLFNQYYRVIRNAISQYCCNCLEITEVKETYTLKSPSKTNIIYLHLNKNQKSFELLLQTQIESPDHIVLKNVSQSEIMGRFKMFINQQKLVLVLQSIYSISQLMGLKSNDDLFHQIGNNISLMIKSIQKYFLMATITPTANTTTSNCTNKGSSPPQQPKSKIKWTINTIKKCKNAIQMQIKSRQNSTIPVTSQISVKSLQINPQIQNKQLSQNNWQAEYHRIKQSFKQKNKTSEQTENFDNAIIKFIKFIEKQQKDWKMGDQNHLNSEFNYGYLRKVFAKYKILPFSLYSPTNFLIFEGLKKQVSEQNSKQYEDLLISKIPNPLIDINKNSFLIELITLLSLRSKNHIGIADYYLESITTINQVQELYVKYYPADLQQIIEDPNFKVKKYLQISKILCSAIEFLSKNKIIHRDLKPANITVDKDYSPKIIDFGSSKLLNSIRHDIPVDYRLISTSGYYYPYENYIKLRQNTNSKLLNKEQYQSHRYFDLYSLGSIFQHIFLKHQVKVGTGQIIFMNLDWLIKKCKMPDPKDRPNPQQVNIFMRIICQLWLLQNKQVV